MLRSFAINAVGPAMLLKHFADLLPRDRKAAFATLSARVGSIDGNRLGGWTTYRTAKAALNQVVRCAAIEIARKRPHAVIVALHPGTIETPHPQVRAGTLHNHPRQGSAPAPHGARRPLGPRHRRLLRLRRQPHRVVSRPGATAALQMPPHEAS